MDLDTKIVSVKSKELSYETVLEKITKTGKAVNSGEADGESRPFKYGEDGELLPLKTEEAVEESKPADSEEKAEESKDAQE